MAKNKLIYQKLLIIFILAFGLNYIWENLHSVLYVHYKGGEITQFALLQSTFCDALFITVLAIMFLKSAYLKHRQWLAILAGFVVAVVVETWALKTGFWAYNGLMPVIPILNVGVTPFLQLGVLSFLVFRLTIKR